MSESNVQNDDMLDEYDFSQAVRGNPYQHLTRSRVRVETSEGNRRHHLYCLFILLYQAYLKVE
ncbi:MAG: hypothetical protein HC899_27730 [Leptolyngbyaceae cyanobacterium SM1_4_3]|nr:hypothetical protein [Leptolyngbyaceae cyanobacterium SM1_4_3]